MNTQDLTTEELEEAEAFRNEMAEDATVEQEPVTESQESVTQESATQEQNVAQEQNVTQESVAQEQNVAQEPELIPGWTASKLQQALEEIPRLRSTLDKTNGTYGSKLAAIQQGLDALRSSRPGGLSVGQLKKVREDFPELAEALEADLAASLQSVSVGGDISAYASKFEQFKAELAQQQQQQALALLSYMQPDWQEIASYTPTEHGVTVWKNPAFGNWVTSQPSDVQKEILGNDPFAVAKHIGRFKSETAPTAEQPKVEAKKQATARLAAAVQPKSSAPVVRSVLTPEEEEHQAFIEEMKRETF